MNIIAINPRISFDPREDRAVFRRIFDNRLVKDGSCVDFSALNEAQEFLAARGFSYGPACEDNGQAKPQGVMYGRDWRIAKWRNLTADEQARLHGTITGDRRRGPIRVAIFFEAPAFAIAAVAEPYIADRIVSTWANQR
jgi:hypothetical protein